MKHLLFTCLCAICYFSAPAQTLNQNINNKLILIKPLKESSFSLTSGVFNFSSLFMYTDNAVIYGFIGDNYQRLKIKFITVTKDTANPVIYIVSGKSMVKNNICEFRGTMTISTIRKYKTMSYGVDSIYYSKGIKGQYVILGYYSFAENKNQALSGTFKGFFQSNFYLDKNNKVNYDDISIISDGFTNNQFTGKWISYKGNLIKQCNWADYRIPNSGELDIGAGEFSPDDKYLKYGWQSIRDLMTNQTYQKAKQIEEHEWWK